MCIRDRGTLFLCLLRKFFPHLPLQRNFQYAKKVQKKNCLLYTSYYTINEAAAKRAKDMNSFSDYKQGSATAEYRHYVCLLYTSRCV